MAEGVLGEFTIKAALFPELPPQADLSEHGDDGVKRCCSAIWVDVLADASRKGKVILGDCDQTSPHIFAP